MRQTDNDPLKHLHDADEYLRTAYRAYGTCLMEVEYRVQDLEGEIQVLTHQLDRLNQIARNMSSTGLSNTALGNDAGTQGVSRR